MSHLREISRIAFPLMLTNLSSNLMLFLDRLILAHYSTDAMNAAITIGMTCSIFLFAMSAITSTAEIFIGRYNGAQEWKRIGEPVWQMIWFSLFTFLIFIPLAWFAGPVLIPEKYLDSGLSFYQWYMMCGPIFPLVMAITSFFAGRGKVKLITLIMILGNCLNLILAIPLILGIPHLFTALGMKGAAIATITAQLFQAIILFLIFINKKNREQYGTAKYYFNLKLFLEGLQVGLPMAIGYMIEVGAWAYLLQTLTITGNEYITVFAIGQSLFVLFAFISEGMQKSITILTANLIGSRKELSIPALVKSAVKLQFLIGLPILIAIVFCSDSITQLFISKTLTQNVDELRKISEYALLWFWVFFICDGCKWIIASSLIALKKTTSVMLINFFSIWFFAVLPIRYYVSQNPTSPLVIWKFVVLYSILNTGLLLLGYSFPQHANSKI